MNSRTAPNSGRSASSSAGARFLVVFADSTRTRVSWLIRRSLAGIALCSKDSHGTHSARSAWLPGAALEVELPDSTPSRAAERSPTVAPLELLTEADLRAKEIQNLRGALLAADGKVCGKGEAAEPLGMRPTMLASRMKALKLDARSLRRGSAE
jgi:hypothetical protein